MFAKLLAPTVLTASAHPQRARRSRHPRRRTRIRVLPYARLRRGRERPARRGGADLRGRHARVLRRRMIPVPAPPRTATPSRTLRPLPRPSRGIDRLTPFACSTVFVRPPPIILLVATSPPFVALHADTPSPSPSPFPLLLGPRAAIIMPIPPSSIPPLPTHPPTLLTLSFLLRLIDFFRIDLRECLQCIA
ncbi:hypothetical protein FB451DRAFT_1442707 [Mycena latifolia]|nr:hypothetical protein FB451DRAFT_1442707 [Mycena latifolia]